MSDDLIQKGSPLSVAPSANKWLNAFPKHQQMPLAELLDTLVLLDDTAVAAAVQDHLDELSQSKERFALFAEREMTGKAFFQSTETADASGQLHFRAEGRKGPPPVSPRRGASRVGSEGHIAFLISQAVKTHPKIYLNHPGPDRFRKKQKKGVHNIAIVTDFIGSGSRIRMQLDAMWSVPSIASWHSMGLLSFYVVAAATTASGKRAIEKHKVCPKVFATYVVPTLKSYTPRSKAEVWIDLAKEWGPSEEPLGHGDEGALIAFRYGMPNNAPRFLWDPSSDCEPLFKGPASKDLRSAFLMQLTRFQQLGRSLANVASWLKKALVSLLGTAPDRVEKLVLLNSLRGRWHPNDDIEIAERTGLTVPAVHRLYAEAKASGWIGKSGRLTDSGRKLLGAASAQTRTKPVVQTNSKSYCPLKLRAP